MAVAAATVWEVRTAGNDTNGGGFVTGAAGTDYSQQDAKNTGTGTDDSTTDAVANGTTTITSATANFQASIVGNIIYLQGGTGALAATRRQVTARTNATTITVEATVAAGTGITMNIGGALASLGEAGRNFTSANTVWIKSGSYSITTTSTNVSNGLFSKSATQGIVIGYNSARGDFGTAPVLTASGISSFTAITLGTTTAVNILANITVDCAGLTSSRAFAPTGRLTMYKCTALNCTNNGFSGGSDTIAIECRASGCSTQPAFVAQPAISCVADSNTATGFQMSSETAVNCISSNNSGGSSHGFQLNGGSARVINCTAYNNGLNGIDCVATTAVINCIAEDNAAVGIDGNNTEGVVLINNAAFSNGTDHVAPAAKAININPITGSASFFTNAAGDDFSLNDTAGGGALLRAASVPQSFPGLSTNNFLDIGAVQHEDSGGGGGEHSAVF